MKKLGLIVTLAPAVPVYLWMFGYSPAWLTPERMFAAVFFSTMATAFYLMHLNFND